MDKERFEKFQPLDFLDFAKKLIDYNNEYCWENSSLERTVFGRIYYGTFLYVREWLSDNTDFNVKNNGKDHKNVPTYIKLKGPFDEDTNEDISDYIKQLRKLRNQADYNLKIPDENSTEYGRWNNRDVGYAIDLAEDVINCFKNYNQ